MELNPLLTLPAIQTDLYPTFLFSQTNIQRAACCFEPHVLGWFWVDFYHKCQESG